MRVLKMAQENKATQKQGTQEIEVGQRHFRHLLRKYRRDGPESIISGHRAKPSNKWMLPEKRGAFIKKNIRSMLILIRRWLVKSREKERAGSQHFRVFLFVSCLWGALHRPAWCANFFSV